MAMAASLQGSIFITGCSRGIGLTIVKKLLNQPVQPKHVIATCRSLDGAQELAQLAAKHANLHLLQFDVTATSRLPEIVNGSIGDNRSGRFYAYRASKVALNMITKSLSVDLAKDHIFAVPFYPEWVITDMGGPGGKFTPEESIDGLFKVVTSLTPESSGTFVNFTGEVMPW